MKRSLYFATGLVAIAGVTAAVIAVRARRHSTLPAAPVVAQAAATAHAATDGGAADEDRSFVGVLLPPQAVNVASREDGKIAGISVHVGDSVREGDVLAQLDDRVKRHELAIARASLRAAQAQSSGAGVDLASARDRSKRRTATVQVGNDSVPVVSGEEAATAAYDARSAASRAVSAGANVHVAAARVSQLKAELEQLVLRAPFDGIVSARYADTGAFLHAGDPAARVLGAGGLRVRFAFAEEDTPRVKEGRRIEASVEGGKLRGAIERVAPEVEPSSRTIFAEASLDPKTSDCGGDCARLAGRTVRVLVLEEAAGPSAALDSKPDRAKAPR